MHARILVALDGSRHSEEMLAYATGMAAQHGTPIELLRVVEKDADSAEATAYIEQLAAAHGARGRCVVSGGDVAETILAAARATPDTLVAMTSRGRSGLMEAVLGSVALRVVRGSGNTPVLVYRPTGTTPGAIAPIKVRSVVLPLDGTELSEAMGEQAAALAHWLGAELMVVNVVEPRDTRSSSPATSSISALESGYVRSNARNLAERHGVKVSWEVLHGEPAEAISAQLAGRRDAILAMATRARPALETAFLGSVTSGCLRRAGVPVLMRAPA